MLCGLIILTVTYGRLLNARGKNISSDFVAKNLNLVMVSRPLMSGTTALAVCSSKIHVSAE